MTPRDPLAVIMARRWWLVAATVLGLAAGVAYYALAARRYEAQVTIVPAQQRPAIPVGAASSGASDSAAKLMDLGLLGGGSTVSVNRIAAVLQSQTVSDSVIEKLALLKHYGTAHIEQAREQLWSVCSATVDRRAELVRLTCEDREPAVARDTAAQIAAFGRDAFVRVSSTHASEERAFLENQVADARKRADEAARKLGEYQRDHAIVDFPEQAKAVVETVGTLEGQRISKQLELEYTTTFASAHEASASALQAQLAVIDHKIDELVATPHAGMFPAVSQMPGVGYELALLMREQTIRQTVYIALTERLELARADEVRDASTFQILDEPALPTYRTWPTFAVIPMGAAAGAFAALLLVLVPGWWRGLARRSELEAEP